MQVKPGEFMSATECIRRTIATEGVVALWYGSVPAFLGAMSENAVAFSVNGTIKRVLGIRDNASSDYQPPLHEPFLIGGVTGSITAFVLCPCDVLKCRAQTNHANGLARESFTQLLQRTYRMEGMRGLYKGMGAQILRDIPFYSSFFGSYDILCMGLKRFTSLSDTAVYFLAGGLVILSCE